MKKDENPSGKVEPGARKRPMVLLLVRIRGAWDSSHRIIIAAHDVRTHSAHVANKCSLNAFIYGVSERVW